MVDKVFKAEIQKAIGLEPTSALLDGLHYAIRMYRGDAASGNLTGRNPRYARRLGRPYNQSRAMLEALVVYGLEEAGFAQPRRGLASSRRCSW